MKLYEIFPALDIDYTKLKLHEVLGRTIETIYWFDKEKDRIRIFLRTSGDINIMRQFFAVKPVEEKDIPVPPYIVEVTLKERPFPHERDFFAPILYHDLSNFVMELPPNYQLRVWLNLDNMVKWILRQKVEKNGNSTTIDQQIKSLIKNPVYLVKIYILGDDKGTLKESVTLLHDYISTHSGALGYRLSKTKGLFSRWEDKIPKLGWSDVTSELRIWLWSTDDDYNKLIAIPKTGKVRLAVTTALPYSKLERKDFYIGDDVIYDEKVYLDWVDFQRHALILGATGSGKSNTLEILAQELMKYGLVVFVDPNSQSARKLSQIADFYFTIGSPNRDPNFGINPLTLPKFFTRRDDAVDYTVGKAVQLFKKMLNLEESAVYVLFIIKVVLRALLKKYDEITFNDFYETILALKNEELDPAEFLTEDDKKTMSELQFIQKLQDQSFASVLARLEDFVSNRKFRIITSQNTIDWDKLIEATGGKGLISFDVGKGENEDLSVIAQGLIAISLFNYVFMRDALKKEKKPIFLIIDEAHNIAHFDFIVTILKEARKYALHLVMATQSMAGLKKAAGPEGSTEINNNTNVKLIMTVKADDERKAIVESIGGQFKNIIDNMLGQLPIGQGFLIVTARSGELVIPKLIQVRLSTLDEKNEKEPTKGFEPHTSNLVKAGHPIRRFFVSDYYTPLQQRIFYLLETNDGMITFPELLKELGIDRDRLNLELSKMQGIEIEDGKPKRIRLEDDTWMYRGLDNVAPSDEGIKIAKEVLMYYVSQGYYVIPGRQNPELPLRPDMIAVKLQNSKLIYDNNIAIEIESPNELSTHSEQVAKNMRKYLDPSMKDFKEVHIWTSEEKFSKLQQIYESFIKDESIPQEYKAKVKIFSVKLKQKVEQKAEKVQKTQTLTGEFTEAKAVQVTESKTAATDTVTVTSSTANNNNSNGKAPEGSREALTGELTQNSESKAENKQQTITQQALEELQLDGLIITKYENRITVKVGQNEYSISELDYRWLKVNKEKIIGLKIEGNKLIAVTDKVKREIPLR
ncbi:VirB4/TraG-like conjugation ATPase [Saccharolobus shibatae B12]|uniref:VirB4/TraG-like conjugation ATPase n=1 Tax=Saccharolobus shibatae (strain ATCC 51178 / DSM 5389 / JCM 8931 / NBRC 15437 / B12) TaxID=523848 RepID=A0A8F5BKW7_SACSH|nr:helicase HerA-like domain-containing protein [Saccharolobus shibatae]QXJ27114.1 VirB4/TraG-like conjugation ATPase [Saccharolobus shibatae B12]QXJ30007.1 VirB4/TraG-like conjugation ATPase [Saccharolobus shibatae B12]